MEKTVLEQKLSQYWTTIQSNLFPWLKEELGPLGDNHLKLVTLLELCAYARKRQSCLSYYVWSYGIERRTDLALASLTLSDQT